MSSSGTQRGKTQLSLSCPQSTHNHVNVSGECSHVCENCLLYHLNLFVEIVWRTCSLLKKVLEQCLQEMLCILWRVDVPKELGYRIDCILWRSHLLLLLLLLLRCKLQLLLSLSRPWCKSSSNCFSVNAFREHILPCVSQLIERPVDLSRGFPRNNHISCWIESRVESINSVRNCLGHGWVLICRKLVQ